MSDSIISFVPRKLEYSNPNMVMNKVIDWMFKMNIIKRTLTDCTLSDNLGYPPSENYKTILVDEDPQNQTLSLKTNGVEIITDRHIFHSGGNGLDEIVCPKCDANIIESDWAEHINLWLEEGEPNTIQCPECLENSDLNDYFFRADEDFYWAFSNIGLSFYNWPPDFTEDFIEQLKTFFESDIIIVYTSI